MTSNHHALYVLGYKRATMAETKRSEAEMALRTTEPLAARMRPRTLDEVVGQRHILGEGKLLRRVIEADRLTNIILFGPPLLLAGLVILLVLRRKKHSGRRLHTPRPVNRYVK